MESERSRQHKTEQPKHRTKQSEAYKHETTTNRVTKKQSRTKQGRVKLLHIGKLIKPKYTQVKLIRQNQQTNEKGIVAASRTVTTTTEHRPNRQGSQLRQKS